MFFVEVIRLQIQMRQRIVAHQHSSNRDGRFIVSKRDVRKIQRFQRHIRRQ